MSEAATGAQKSEQKIKKEILTISRFYLELTIKGSDHPLDAYFIECQGLKRTLETIEHCEVMAEQWGSKPAKTGRVVRGKIPGNIKTDNITLRQGLSISPTVWRWLRNVENGLWAKSTYDGDISIYHQGDGENAAARFRFFGAWPISYKISDLKADSSDFQLEELVLAVDDFIRVKPDGNEY